MSRISLKPVLLKEKTQEMLSIVLFVTMYVCEYLIAQTLASVTVLGFHDADLNSVICLIGIDLFNYNSTVQHETQISFNLLSYYQQRVQCELQTVPKLRRTTSNTESVTSQKGEGLNLSVPTFMNSVVLFTASL